jgi:hypothetical protein
MEEGVRAGSRQWCGDTYARLSSSYTTTIFGRFPTFFFFLLLPMMITAQEMHVLISE